MDYRVEALKCVNRDHGITREYGLRFKPYFIEYARQAAERAGFNTQEFKRTNKLCEKYPLFRDMFVVMEIITEASKLLTAKGTVDLSAEELTVLTNWTHECMASIAKEKEAKEQEELFKDEDVVA